MGVSIVTMTTILACITVSMKQAFETDTSAGITRFWVLHVNITVTWTWTAPATWHLRVTIVTRSAFVTPRP